MRQWFVLAAALVMLLVLLEHASCHKKYVSYMPNGESIPLHGKKCKATGHVVRSSNNGNNGQHFSAPLLTPFS